MQKTMTVQGTGAVQIRPNWVVVCMNIENRGKEYNAVMKQANGDLEALRVAVVSAGFGKTSCKTTGFYVDTQYHNRSDGIPELECYVARHGLRMEFPFQKRRLGILLSALAACTVTPEISVHFTVKEKEQVAEQLLENAVADARKRAKVLARAAGVKLGELKQVKYQGKDWNLESATHYGVPPQLLRARAEMIRMEPEKIVVRDTVTIIWKLEK
ncbi:MAG: SIMPL domain-containing protein [Clostridiales bacterium]|nr:SIMPL domain-containing protein [Clostridiales bacterium]